MMIRSHPSTERRHCLSAFAIVGFALLAASVSNVPALEPPRPGEIEKLRQAGTLKDSLDKAAQLGNHRIDPERSMRLKHQIEQLQGRTTFAPPPAWRGMPSTGNVRIFALLIDFPDYPHTVAAGTVDNMLFGAGDPADYPRESLTSYYDRASYGLLDLGNGATFGWYQPAYNRSGVVETGAGRDNLIKEALNSFDASQDFSVYDNDGDGDIDYFVVMWTGPVGDWATFWWGYQTSFGDGAYLLDGKRLSKYSWQWELDNPLVVIHETGHALGLPDYYDYDDTVGPDGGLGGFDMMDANSFDHNAFSKWLLDWLTPTVVAGARELKTLNPSATHPEALLVWPGAGLDDQFSEFYVVQNRQSVLNDDMGFGPNGLSIWHVDSTLNVAGTDYLYNNSDTSHKLLRLMEADGLEQIEATLCCVNNSDLYGEGDRFSHVTTPSSAAYSGADSCVTVCGIDDLGNDAPITASVSTECSAPPVCNANGPYSAECQGTSTSIQLDGTGTTDPDAGEPREFRWTTDCPGGTFDDNTSPTPILTVNTTSGCNVSCSATVEVTDCAGNVVSCSSPVAISDTTPPLIVCPADITVECTGQCGIAANDPQLTAFFASVGAVDRCDPAPVLSNSAPAFFGMGSTPITFTATDSCTNAASCVANVTVLDRIPPEIRVTLSRYTLWPPNHKMVDITANVVVTDTCDPNPGFWLNPVTSDEPADGHGDGNTSADIEGVSTFTPDTAFRLRSERSGQGDGRTYIVPYTAYDTCALPPNTTNNTSWVNVPHDQSSTTAFAGNGFNPRGTGFGSTAQIFELVVLSMADLDASALNRGTVKIGSTEGTIDPIETRAEDFDCDGRTDLVTVYSKRDANALLLTAGRLSFRYETATGVGYLAQDIFSLGPPLRRTTCPVRPE